MPKFVQIVVILPKGEELEDVFELTKGTALMVNEAYTLEDLIHPSQDGLARKLAEELAADGA